MKNTSRRWLISAALLISSPSWAGDFQHDLQQLKEATKFGNIATDELERYLDPTKGPVEFRLNQKNAPWAGNYNAMQKGGVAYRWQVDKPADVVPTKKEVQETPKELLSWLSPIEKYDILKNDYDFKATKFELTRRGPQRASPVQDWEGFCNGVRCAGFLLPEPQFAVEVVNADGVRIEFQPADLKALAGVSYFYVEKYAGLGAPSRDSARAADQPNPAIFDLALRYNLATKRKTFVIDSNLTSEIWNETIVGYKRNVRPAVPLNEADKKKFPRAVAKRTVWLRLETLGEIDMNKSNQPTRAAVAEGTHLQGLTAAYILYLDEAGRAIDGVWHKASKDRGIDFAWFAGGKGTDASNGWNTHLDFNTIRKLFKEATTPSCGKLFF